MKIRINKNIFKCMLCIFCIAILISVGMFITNIIEKNAMKNSISKINAEDLQNKIIAKLEETKLNLNNDNYTTVFRKFYKGKPVLMEELTIKMNETDSGTKNIYEDYISAYIYLNSSKETEYTEGVIVPVFKIKNDNNGNFVSIEYIETLEAILDVGIKNIIETVFKEDYGIDIRKCSRDMKKLFGNDKISIVGLNDELVVDIANSIRADKYASFVTVKEKATEIRKDMYTIKFGTDVNK